MPVPAWSTRTAMDRIPRGERGGGRQEGIRWAGKGNYCPPLSGGGPLSIHRGWEAAYSEGQEQYNTPFIASPNHPCNEPFTQYR